MLIKKSLENELGRWNWKTQSIGGDEPMPVPQLLSKIERGFYKTEEFDLHIDSYNLADSSFKCDDLFDFLTHYKLVTRANLEYPIIMNNRGQVIDGRHRICKAIMLGKKKLSCIRILDSDVV